MSSANHVLGEKLYFLYTNFHFDITSTSGEDDIKFFHPEYTQQHKLANRII